ncbi:hypothetical protein DYB36_004341 [Aphanomyces astaci]|uniref:FYVE-type domain-containing protein n=1 Tax=Aphanomyces astaci TaxID=112090 RepID=A0A397AYQ7_APHAT|nr:hypothetical protein DYB36_004341 [Aphanomyces astaci]
MSPPARSAVSPISFPAGRPASLSMPVSPSAMDREAHAVRSKCSKSLKAVQSDTIPHAPSPISTSPTSNNSAGGHAFDDSTSSQSSWSSTSSVVSTASTFSSPSTHRRIKARCCKTCATFSPTLKAPSRCEFCRSTAGLFRKKLKCQVCQKFACKACGHLQDGAPFGIRSEAKVWVCTVCDTAHDRQTAKAHQSCHVCKEQFAEFKRRCRCKTCGATTCVQCSVSVAATTPGHPLDTRECRTCVAEAAKAMQNETLGNTDESTHRTSTLHLTPVLEFAKDVDTSSFGSRMRTVERSCAAVLIGVGVTVVIVVALLVYFYIVSVIVEDSWVASWYSRHVDEL